MLTVEEIKKACEFADGFEWSEQEIFYLPNGKHYLVFPTFDLKRVDNWSCYVYPLFLQRVIEGINGKDLEIKGRSYHLEINQDGVYVNYRYTLEIGYIEGFKDFEIDKNFTIDQAKEQAIKYILEQL